MIATPGVLLEQSQRVLIVDDERANRNLLEAMLLPEGHTLVTASSGEEALGALSINPPDLILLDVMMPGMDGYEVAATIKRNPVTQHIPVIMVTALNDRNARMRGLECGVEDFLNKPVDREELRVRVRNLLKLKAHVDYYGKYSEMLERRVALRTAELAERTASLEVVTIALKESEERTNYALGGALIGVWELDIETKSITLSHSMASVLHLPPSQRVVHVEEALGFVHKDDRQMLRDSAERAFGHGDDFQMEFRVMWPDGSTRWLVGRAQLIRDSAGKPVRLLGIGGDISEKKALEAQLRQSQKMEAVGLLAGGVAHDFNNLLTVIMSYSDLVIHDLPRSDEHHSDMQHVINAAKSAAALTRQLLAFSRKQILKPSTVDLNIVVTDMAEMFSRLIGAGFELETVLQPELGMVRADRGQLEQVLMNLVLNARDAMPHGGKLQIETANSEVESSAFVTFSVRDSGEGMDEDTQRKLFEPFFTTKVVGKGTGLGLATVYGIVQQSGGRVEVESAPGKGSTFKVLLPRADG
jgi:signal transduction histidine kinase/DNA-binding response OmpR family regulator